ncbi:hypothetical protein RFI_30803 [Reticulomyxa filosa]|uniref:Uncharacterized protein n=1 Tax=Reticulomyxa filosa TaxID=46433 RepID=X6LY89_RETFI|nr:hypothetical protein RFI_30803 [Reticulomyxa filosa]|eukprot:ETO06589.1 hypothetical protein RFI_30803 [Reticulomyxa filosa]
MEKHSKYCDNKLCVSSVSDAEALMNSATSFRSNTRIEEILLTDIIIEVHKIRRALQLTKQRFQSHQLKLSFVSDDPFQIHVWNHLITQHHQSLVLAPSLPIGGTYAPSNPPRYQAPPMLVVICFVCVCVWKGVYIALNDLRKTSESPIGIQVESATGKTKMIEMLQFLVNECRQTLYLKGFELYGLVRESERAIEWAKAIAKEYYYDLIGQDIGELVIGSEIYSSFANEVQPSEYLFTSHVNALHLLTTAPSNSNSKTPVKYALNVVDAGNQILKTKPNEPITAQVTRKYVPDYLLRSSANGQNEEDLEGEKEEDVKRQSENDTVENDGMISSQWYFSCVNDYGMISRKTIATSNDIENDMLNIGTKVQLALVPPSLTPTIHNFDFIVAVRNNVVVDVWNLEGRSPGH